MKAINKVFIKYVSLNIMSMIGLSCYILADTFFISSGVGSLGIAALNIVLPVYSLLNALALLLGMGGATLFSIYRAQGLEKQANSTFTYTVIIGGILAVFFTTIALFGTPFVVSLLTSSAELVDYCIAYLRTMLFFSTFFILNQIFICFVRNDGQPNLTMIAMVTGSLTNIVLDYVFVFPFDMGMFGAALATCISPIISLCILSIHYFKKNYHFHLIKVQRTLLYTKKLVAIGFPSFVTEFSSGIVMLLFNMMIFSLSGDIGVAAYGIIANLALIVVSIFTGISQGIQPLISENYGKSNYTNLRIIIANALALALVLGVIFFVIGLLFSDTLVAVFNSEGNTELARLATVGLKTYFTAFIIMGINIVTSSIYAALSKSKESFIISLSRGIIMIVPSLFILSNVFGMMGVWTTVLCSEIATLMIVSLLYSKSKATIKTLQTQKA